MFIVAGVTGNTGKVVAESLIAGGQSVTVVLRDPAKADSWLAKGAAVATLDLTDTAKLTALLATAQGAYLLSPPNNRADDFLADRAHFLNPLAAAVKDSQIPHVVFLSSVGAQHATGTGPIRSLHYAEQVLAPAAHGITFLRAAYFLDNWLGAYHEGALHNFLTPGRAVSMISTTDIGRFAAAHLLQPVTGPRAVEITGPVDYTPEDIASAFGPQTQLLSHPIETMALSLQAFGFSPNAAALMQEMTEGINSGHVAFEGAPLRGTVSAQAALRP